MRVPAAGGLVLSAALLACAGDPAAPPTPLRSLQVNGRVLDDAGAPVGAARVRFEVWYSGLKSDPPHTLPQPWAVSDADGRYVLRAGDLAAAPIDSIRLWTAGFGCNAAPSSATMIRGEDLPEGPDGELARDLPAGPQPAPPVTAVGQYCAQGDDPHWGPEDMYLALSIDSLLGDAVLGRWFVAFQHTSVGPEGQFAGVQRNGLLVLSMRRGEWPYGGCTELRLVIPIAENGAWGTAQVLQDDGCLLDRAPLVFTSTRGWFPT